jgi:hypothetical protein
VTETGALPLALHGGGHVRVREECAVIAAEHVWAAEVSTLLEPGEETRRRGDLPVPAALGLK